MNRFSRLGHTNCAHSEQSVEENIRQCENTSFFFTGIITPLSSFSRSHNQAQWALQNGAAFQASRLPLQSSSTQQCPNVLLYTVHSTNLYGEDGANNNENEKKRNLTKATFRLLCPLEWIQKAFIIRKGNCSNNKVNMATFTSAALCYVIQPFLYYCCCAIQQISTQ